MIRLPFFFKMLSFTILLYSCQEIETGETLSANEVAYIKKLGLLDDGEKILKFYSEYNKKAAGNFFTNKRLAKYWIDENDSSRNYKNYAFYQDIITIDSNYMRGAVTLAPYLEVTRKDSSRFQIAVDGSEEDIKSFFEEAIAKWRSFKKQKNE